MKHLLLLACLLGWGAAFSQDVQQQFYPNGQLESTRFNDGSRDRFIAYFESGRVKCTGSFKDGLRQGTWKEYNENGVVMAEAEFDQGRSTGQWQFRDGNNILLGRLTYNAGKLVEGKQYADGALIAQRDY